MTDTEFCNSFVFNRYTFKQTHSTDLMTEEGCPRHYIAHLVRGTAKIVTAARTLHLQAGDVFYLPKGLRYRSYWYPTEGEVQFYSFGFGCFPADGALTYPPQAISCLPAGYMLLEELEQALTVTPLSIGRLYRFLGEIYETMQTEPVVRTTVLLNRALAYMEQNDSCRIADIARHCGVSESCLFLKFRQHLHRTPVEMHHTILAEKAKTLLRTTDLSVEEISSHLQCSSSSYFRKIFSAQTGLTPTAYRKQTRDI